MTAYLSLSHNVTLNGRTSQTIDGCNRPAFFVCRTKPKTPRVGRDSNKRSAHTIYASITPASLAAGNHTLPAL
jgi:hypothetical protein